MLALGRSTWISPEAINATGFAFKLPLLILE